VIKVNTKAIHDYFYCFPFLYEHFIITSNKEFNVVNLSLCEINGYIILLSQIIWSVRKTRYMVYGSRILSLLQCTHGTGKEINKNFPSSTDYQLFV